MISTVGLQYAKAIYDLANEKKLEDLYFENLKLINNLVNNDENVLKIFSHPSINKEEKKSILKNILEQRVEDEFLHFLYVLIDNDRFVDLNDIVDSYQFYLNEKNKECNATVFTKYNLNEEEKTQIKNKLQLHFNKKINLTVTIDENMIGGIIINIDGKVIDGSIFNQMQDLKNELKKGW